MPIIDIFSKRKKKAESNEDPLIYNELSESLRIQIYHLWNATIGPYGYSGGGLRKSPYSANKYWQFIQEALCREYGKFSLIDSSNNPYDDCTNYLFNADVDGALDIIELSFNVLEGPIRTEVRRGMYRVKQSIDDAITELNNRFLENNVGYQYVGKKIIRLDSEYLHKEVTIPAINLLQNKKYEGALDEFMKAHEHYKNHRYKEAIVEALKAFESTMKSICKENKWKVEENATANKLIETCFENELIPASLTSHINALKATLESGVPTIRNKMSAHGQGKEKIEIPSYIANYALNITGSNIILLINANDNRIKKN